MYGISLINSLGATPILWPDAKPTSLHLEIANLMRAQFQPGPGFGEVPPENAAAAVDSIMRADRRFFDIDLRQIAKILFQGQGQSLAPKLRRSYDQWYELLKNAWGWRLVAKKICPVELMVDPTTKDCILDPEKVYWPQVEPTDLHSRIAAMVKDQLWPDVQYPPESAIADVDSAMGAEQGFSDMDLRQIAKKLTEIQVPRLMYGQWYELLKSAWGWRVIGEKTCPPGFILDSLTKECTPVPEQEPDEEKSKVPLFLIGGLAVGLLLFSRK